MKYIKYATVILPLCLFFGFILYSSHLLYQPGAVLVWNTILSVSQSSRVSVLVVACLLFCCCCMVSHGDLSLAP